MFSVGSIPDDQADEHFRSQHTFIADEGGRVAVDFVGRFEGLTEDFLLVQQRLGLPPTPLPRLQRANQSKRYAAFYTAETKRAVAERFATDIDLFGYSFEE